MSSSKSLQTCSSLELAPLSSSLASASFGVALLLAWLQEIIGLKSPPFVSAWASSRPLLLPGSHTISHVGTRPTSWRGGIRSTTQVRLPRRTPNIETSTYLVLNILATAVSGAFSGLLAAVIIQHLDGKRGLAGWKWLLLIEGVGSSFAGFFTWMILPDWPSTTKWLTEEETFLAVQRLKYDGIAASGGSEAAAPTHGEAFRSAFRDWRLYPLIFMYMLATGSQTIQYFVPTLVGQLGYTGYVKQYMTIPIYAVAFVFILAFCFISDYRKERGHYISITAAGATISFIITVAVDDKKVKYAFLCFAVGFVYAACPLTLLWVSKIFQHPAEKRAVCIAIVNALGNSASIYGSFLWPSKTAPRYVQGFATTM